MRNVDAHQILIVEQAVTQSRSDHDAEKEPHVERHRNQHQHVTETELKEVQKRLEQMMQPVQSASAHRTHTTMGCNVRRVQRQQTELKGTAICQCS